MWLRCKKMLATAECSSKWISISRVDSHPLSCAKATPRNKSTPSFAPRVPSSVAFTDVAVSRTPECAPDSHTVSNDSNKERDQCAQNTL